MIGISEKYNESEMNEQDVKICNFLLTQHIYVLIVDLEIIIIKQIQMIL